ncbi:Ras family small GTPase (macronuclear) [Tetrahymena thermophila SB210]|uniref:Ras family small GTPase n=1 Tax=Tetrahymena thermophila (strain SB210) TaxID=312017 RepID=Q236Y3_TETTS|nr:Ras family small GTPase [Tetrahymena thermophila SB210]EAR92367.1 Ras family small GTPase [Tetrahymena thermophila SB210]|eukprot:XP_001012612.1 Ras family small GTPase [Tetrahymena thermophila SB210]
MRKYSNFKICGAEQIFMIKILEKKVEQKVICEKFINEFEQGTLGNLFQAINYRQLSSWKDMSIAEILEKQISKQQHNHIGYCIDYYIKKLEINKKKLKLYIWDTAGSERFRTITSNYFKAAHGILVAYSVEDQESFEKVGSWIQCIKEKCDNANISILLVGNKSDSKQRVVSLEQGEKLAEQYNIPFQETSALDNINVSESFDQLAIMCLDQYEIKSSTISPQSNIPKKKQENGETKKNCC